MSDTVLKINGLGFSYDGNRVLDNLTLEVRKGSFVSILGPNGSGKSTLINLLSRVLKGYDGTIELFGRDLSGLSARESAGLVAVVPQYSNPGFDFTVGEIVMMGRFAHVLRFGAEKKADFTIAESVMEKTKVLSFASKRFHELSGGEKQRVIIAQALAQDAPLILLDEPTSHLDINFQIEIMDLFYRLNRDEEKTIIGVFHDINLAANYSKTAVFLKQGTVFAQGDINSVITRENVRNVFRSDVYVSKNPFTGKTYISPMFSHDLESGPSGGAASGEADGTTTSAGQSPLAQENIGKRVHVIGGGGAASAILSMLYNRGYTLTCGVVNNFDTDLDTSEMLGIPYVSEAPFSPISFNSQNKNLDFIRSSDAVILPEVAFGHGNFSNLISVKEALEMGKKVIITGGSDFKSRDYTEGKALKIYEKLLEKGAIVVDNISKIPEFI